MGDLVVAHFPDLDPGAAERLILEWPGWRARRIASRFAEFSAPILPSAIAPLIAHGVHFESALDRDFIAAVMSTAERAIRALVPGPQDPEVRVLSARKPFEHQAAALRALAFMRYQALIADEMGLGKTSTALWAVERAGCARVLVVSPKSLLRQWEREVGELYGSTVAVTLIQGTPAQRAKRFDDLAAKQVGGIDERFLMAVVGYDTLRRLTEAQVRAIEAFIAGQAVILDESHAIKSSRTQRSSWVHEHLGGARVRLLLSGTPILNHVDDLYPQITFVHPGTWRSRTDFADRYLKVVERDFGGGRLVRKVVGSRNLTDLQDVLKFSVIRRKKADVLKLPPKIHTYPPLELDGPELALYKAMKQDAQVRFQALGVTDMPVFVPEAKSVVEAILRCEQIAHGFIGGIPPELIEGLGEQLDKAGAERIPGRPGELMLPNSAKVEWLLDVLGQLEDLPAVVFSRFNAPLLWLHSLTPDRSRLITGASSADERDVAVQDFQNGRTNRLYCQVKIAQGFQLTRAQDVIFWSRDWSPQINAQAEDRAHRIGTKGTVNVQIPYCVNTVEKLIHKRLSAKDANAEQALASVTLEEMLEAL